MHDLKHPSGIIFILISDPKVADESEVHESKILIPRLFALIGISMDLSDVHPENAKSPIYLMNWWIFIDFKEMHREKAWSYILVTDGGIVNEDNLKQPEKQ